jgi:predicted TIM-barrel fold metal-dependent hydrolase
MEINQPFPVDDGRLLDLLAEWARDPATRRKILVANPARLYGF